MCTRGKLACAGVSERPLSGVMSEKSCLWRGAWQTPCCDREGKGQRVESQGRFLEGGDPGEEDLTRQGHENTGGQSPTRRLSQ